MSENGEEEQLEVEFFNKKPKIKKSNDPKELLDTLMEFFNRDAPVVIDYIEDNNIPPHYITIGRRIDLHPAREYLIRLVRISKDCVAINKLLENDTDELDKFFD